MARYRKVEVRMWGDEKFRKLSKPLPNAQTLWFYLLTGPHTSIVPGLFCAGRLQLAEAIGWPIEDFDTKWAEVEAQKLARADWEARVVWLPRAMYINEPESPNVAANWRGAMVEIPECPLRSEADDEIGAFMAELGSAYEVSWGHGARPHQRVPIDLARRVKARDGSKCRYCGGRVDWSDRKGADGATYDHVDPRGDSTMANVVVACRKCNNLKGLRTPHQASMDLLRSDLDPDLDHDLDPDLSNDPDPIQTTRRNQEQEQDQDQDQEQEQETDQDHDLSGSSKAPESKSKPKSGKREVVTGVPGTWDTNCELCSHDRAAFLSCTHPVTITTSRKPSSTELLIAWCEWFRALPEDGRKIPRDLPDRDLMIAMARVLKSVGGDEDRVRRAWVVWNRNPWGRDQVTPRFAFKAFLSAKVFPRCDGLAENQVGAWVLSRDIPHCFAPVADDIWPPEPEWRKR